MEWNALNEDQIYQISKVLVDDPDAFLVMGRTAWNLFADEIKNDPETGSFMDAPGRRIFVHLDKQLDKDKLIVVSPKGLMENLDEAIREHVKGCRKCQIQLAYKSN